MLACRTWDDQIRAAGQPPTLLLGVTATPKRGDNIGLEAVFSKIAFERNMREMIEAGWLCRLRGIRVKSETDLDSVSTRAGDFAQDELAEAVNQVDRNKLAVKAYLDYAYDRDKTVVFCVDVEHATKMAEAFQSADITSGVIHGALPKEQRKQLLADFHDGKIRVMTNCQVLCLDSQTEILTSNGWVGIDEMTPEHQVANWESGRIFFETPKLIVRRNRFEGERMVSYASPRHNFRVTEDHRMLVRFGGTANSGSPTPRISLAPSSVPVAGIAEPEAIDLASPEYDTSTLMRRLSSNAYHLRRNEELGYHESFTEAGLRIARHAKQTRYLKSPRDLTLDECRFIGFWLGDGSRSELQSGGVEYSASQSFVYPQIIEWFDGVIERCGFDVARQNTGSPKWGRQVVVFPGARAGPQARKGLFAIEHFLDKDGSPLFWGLSQGAVSGLSGRLPTRPLTACTKVSAAFRITGAQLPLYDLLQAIAVCRGFSATLTRCAPPRRTTISSGTPYRSTPDRVNIGVGFGKFPVTFEETWVYRAGLVRDQCYRQHHDAPKG